MLITGFLSMAVSRGDLLFWLFASLSCASMSIVLLFKYQVFGDALRACCNLDATLYALRNVHIMTTFTWLPYPIINLLSKYDVVSHATEELLWCLFDLSTKICQASALYQVCRHHAARPLPCRDADYPLQIQNVAALGLHPGSFVVAS